MRKRDIERTVVGGGLREPAKPAVKPRRLAIGGDGDPTVFVLEPDSKVASDYRVVEAQVGKDAELPVKGGGIITGPEAADDVDYLEPTPNPTKVTND